jgi:hypothetical protein
VRDLNKAIFLRIFWPKLMNSENGKEINYHSGVRTLTVCLICLGVRVHISSKGHLAPLANLKPNDLT